jgi:hypothetical protein
MWIQDVTVFKDLEAESNMWRKHWVWQGTVMLEAATAFYVQMFFCRRLWVNPDPLRILHGSFVAQAISRNTCLVIICITLFLFGLVTGVVTVCPLQLYFIGTNFCNTDCLHSHKYLGFNEPLAYVLIVPQPLAPCSYFVLIGCSWNTSWSCAVRRSTSDRKHNRLFACTYPILEFLVFQSD